LLVPHGDVERLAQALESLFNDPGRAREMGARGRDRIEKTFSSAQFQSHLTAILANVLA
jgi:glycosyltransferase involved in cell wall biosynthesis